MSLVRPSPAKVNLILNILGRRPDGFHELETVMHPVDLCDELRFERAGHEVELTCNDPSLAVDGTNLVVRAAQAFRSAADLGEGVRIHLEKRIPMAAGLGGGSGNAATTLLGLNELFGRPLPDTTLTELAAQLGSDVPFFLQPRPALATGRGERVTSLDWFQALQGVWTLLIHPGFGIATPWAYQNLARFPAALNGTAGRAARLVEKLQHATLAEAAAGFYNSLEAPALDKYPILALYQEFLREAGALATLMSGSGSTTFALAADQAGAEGLRDCFVGRFGTSSWTAVRRLHFSL